MSDLPSSENKSESEGTEIQDRRLFLQGMGKWSSAAIAAAVVGAWFGSAPEAGAWINRRVGGGWINGGGGGWINRRGGGGWLNGRY